MADGEKRNQENTKLDSQSAAQDVAREDNVVNTGKDRFLKVFNEAKLDYAQRGNFKADALEDFFRVLINQERDKWKGKRAELIAANEAGGEYSLKDLIDGTKSIEENINKISETIALYLQKIAAESPDGKFMPGSIEKMLKSQFSKASQIEKLVTNAPELVSAFKWALKGGVTDKGGQRSIDSGEPQAFKDVESNMDAGADKRSVCWSILGFMDSGRRVKFTKKYTAKMKMDSKALMNFLEEGNLLGVFSPDEMDEVFNGHAKDTQTADVDKKFKQNINQYGITYKAQNDFYEAGQALMRTSYGSVNAAAEMCTAKNAAILLGYTVAGVTLGANVLANTFVAGRMKDPKQLLGIVKNKFVLTSVAAIELLNEVRKPDSVAERYKGKDTEDNEEMIAAKKNIKLVFKTNPDWRPFLEKSDHFGMKAIWDYVVFISEEDSYLPKNLLTKEAFKMWTDKMGRESKDGAKYTAMAEQFNKLNTTDSEFARIARAFNIMKIGKMDAKKNYQQATKNT